MGNRKNEKKAAIPKLTDEQLSDISNLSEKFEASYKDFQEKVARILKFDAESLNTEYDI